MKRLLSCLTVMVVFLVCGLGSAAAQKESRPGTVIVPPTNAVPQKYLGRRAHTNFLIFVPAARSRKNGSSPAAATPSGETPASISCIYQTWAGQISGCPINGTYAAPSGGSNMIAIVDAYDYPTASTDFQTFSSQFGLPSGNSCGASGTAPCFQKMWPISQPRSNCSWAQEEALDIEWAHAMAPYAQIVLVEAASNSNSDLMAAVQYAANLVAGAGGGEVSMSWSGGESSTESTLDGYFTSTGGVSYFASSGDTGGTVGWPSTSPDVISAGGTHIVRDSNGNFTGETVWSSAGAGPSKYEPAPGYQSSINQIAQLLNGYRGTPDISFDADPYTGVSVYDSTSCQGYVDWMVFGGTSVSSPSLAGIFNYAGAFGGGWDSGTNSSNVQSQLYQNYSTSSNGGTASPYLNNFFDVTSGSAGSYSAGNDWDFASGIGTLRGVAGITGSTSPSFSLSVSPSSLSVTQGSSTTVTSAISMTASGGFSGSVDLTASAGSSGLSVSLSPASISGTQTSTLTVGAGTAKAGNYTVTVTGNGTDSSGNPLTSSTTVPVTVAQSSSAGFSLGASSTTITVPVNSSASDTITVTPSSGFTGSVTLSLGGLPRRTNSSFSVNPVSITGTSAGSSTLTISTNRKTTAGTYPLTLTATSGSVSKTLDLTLIVGTSSSPDFSLSATPSSQSVTQGQTASYSVTASSLNNFSGTVNLSATVSPSGPTPSIPASVSVTTSSSGTAALNVSTTGATAGTYTITITGTSGSLTHTATVSLTVGTSSGGGDFSLSASPSSFMLHGGGTATYTITLTPSGGFDQTVNFTVTGEPSGTTPTLSAYSLTGSGTTTLTIVVPSGTNGNYTLIVTGTTGALTHSVSVGLKSH